MTSLKQVQFPTSLRLATLILVFLTLTCFVVEFVCGRLLHLPSDPYSVPLFTEKYPDLLLLLPRFNLFHSPAFFSFISPIPFMYPAPIAVVYRLFYMFPNGPLRPFLFSILASFTVAGVMFSRVMHRHGISKADAFTFTFAVLSCSYPIWFVYKQANMEAIIWVVLTTGVVLFLLGRGYGAAACIGIAASMKIYPLIYFGLFLARRQYRQIAFGIGIIALTTLASLWLVCPDLSTSWHRTNAGLDQFRVMYVLHIRPEIGMDHSLFALLKRIKQPPPSPLRIARVLTPYMMIVAGAGVAAFVLRIQKLPITNQLISLCVASVLFPPVSFEYTLVQLLLPFGVVALLTVDLSRNSEWLPGLTATLLCFVLVLAPVPELIIHGQRFGGQFKCLFLVALFGIALVKPLSLPPGTDDSHDRNRDYASGVF